jgi:hypothetical protein
MKRPTRQREESKVEVFGKIRLEIWVDIKPPSIRPHDEADGLKTDLELLKLGDERDGIGRGSASWFRFLAA